MKKKEDYIPGQMNLGDFIASGDSQIELNIDNIVEIERFIMSLQEKKRNLEIEKEEHDRKERERKQKEKERRRKLAEQKKRDEEARARKEHIYNVTCMELPLDWVNVFDNDASTSDITADSVSDGLIICLNKFARVDIEYISSITGESYKDVICKLKGSIFQNPTLWEECFYKGWETADEYLSGNIRKKLEIAKEATKEYDGYFDDNVEALKTVMPGRIKASDIYVTLGSPWVPVKVIAEFCEAISDIPVSEWEVKHDDITGTWEVKLSKRGRERGYTFTTLNDKYSVRDELGYGWKRDFIRVLNYTLNMKSVEVYVTRNDGSRELDKSLTLMALEKQEQLKKDFQEWIWEDEKRKYRLVELYDSTYSCIKQRNYDGGFLDIPGINPDISLYKYQKDAIARIIFSSNTLLAHEVGAGKTFIMIAAGMEMKRLGMSGCNMYVVPNNILGQWKNTFLQMYPNVNLRVVDSKDFTPNKRQKTLMDICDNDYDAVLIVYSCFTMIPVSEDKISEMLNEEYEELQKVVYDKDKNTSRTVKKMNRIIEEIQKTKEDKIEASKKNPNKFIYFEDLGVTRLFVDEAHNFKNVPIDTQITKVMGISKTGSAKCKDMLMKVRIVQKDNDGKGVIFATGTPITNSITDAFIVQKYLQNGELKILGLQSFDGWVANFAEMATNFEVDVDTSGYRMATRFSMFHNIPELTTILSSVADFHEMDKTSGIPSHDGYEDVVVRKTREFSEFLKNISERADKVRSGKVNRKIDNMLKITTDGRKAALDLRLIDNNSPFTVSSKVFQCADKVAEIYRNTEVKRSTQLVFCDTSTPKMDFNMYDELKGLLVKMGVNSEEIVFIHEGTSEARKEKIFSDMREGKTRVLIGSTFKLGLGVNVQNKLIALHHLDVPWRPADMVQREGRILRQGNENKSVQIFRYITEGSFDAYSWQLLETKQRFITDLLSGYKAGRSGQDIDDTVLDYAEVKALAIGNPLVKQRVEAANKLTKYKILQQKLIKHRQEIQTELKTLEPRLADTEVRIDYLNKDSKALDDSDDKYSVKDKEEYMKIIFRTLNTSSKEPEETSNEKELFKYHGFNVITSRHFSSEHPVLFIQKSGKYMVRLGDNPNGYIQRIENKLRWLKKGLDDAVTERKDIEKRIRTIEKELDSEESYSTEIEECTNELNKIDMLLDVNFS